MGNDQSGQMKGLEIDKKAMEVTDYWTLYTAEVPGENRVNKLTLFQGEQSNDSNIWGNLGPLEKATKNFMIYRHPCILKYVASFNRGSTTNLATERCRPLSLAIAGQTDMEICLGLKNILSALIFLNEQGGMRHLNICSSSIYVTDDGTWKLGGLEYLWKMNEITEILLEKSKSYRYNKAIDEHESKNRGVGLEQYSFGVLCEEILRRFDDNNTLFLKEFKAYCSSHLKHPTPTMRPKLSAILLHSYFNHEFISIHSFLNELPLKNQSEKQHFFTGLVDRLRNFDENVVGAQLGNTLLSRIVMIDASAQSNVLPFLLRPKRDNHLEVALFSPMVFQKYIIPKLKQVFCVRDTQIRLILLEYFHDYMDLFSREDLQDSILPQLLLGIKDTNDMLVATTLRCLADLVTILGASIVIGKNRVRIFSDGRPQGPSEISKHWSEARSITPVLSSVEFANSNSPLPDNVDISESYASVDNGILMPERLSPDGGEDFKTSEIDDEAWTDWEDELEENSPRMNNIDVNGVNGDAIEKDLSTTNLIIETDGLIHDVSPVSRSDSLISPANPKKSITDITELDIKNQKVAPSKNREEMDFFKDMEPVIQKTNVLALDTLAVDAQQSTAGITNLHIDQESMKKIAIVEIDKSRFDIKISDDNLDGDGWGDDDDPTDPSSW